ncbi:MAG: hypothetical protein OHK0046_13860 [Anaerolineae bacterium]
MEELGLWAGFFLTLMVYSYIIRDNFLYRIAVYIFVGLAAGYITIVTFESVLIPWFESTVGSGEAFNLGLGLLPVLVGLLLAFKSFSPRLARLGNLALAFLIGTGAAVALVGALTGTLVPFSRATINASEGDLLEGVIILVGVLSSLVYFQYLARRLPDGTTERPRAVRIISLIGQGFIVVTLGALYATAILTSLTIFSERLSFVLAQLGL